MALSLYRTLNMQTHVATFFTHCSPKFEHSHASIVLDSTQNANRPKFQLTVAIEMVNQSALRTLALKRHNKERNSHRAIINVSVTLKNTQLALAL